MENFYNKLTTEYKVMGRLVNDLQAGNIFFNDNAEILTNTNWQDVKINNITMINMIISQ